ncbi:MAG: flagellar hook-basal body complex protein FliE [Syntrophomonas sp.]
MKLSSVDNSLAAPGVDLKSVAGSSSEIQNKETGFFDYLKDALREVDGLQKDASASAEKLALGDETYLHNTILAYEKANLALQLTVEVRNKILDAYQEIMRIQM